VWQHTMTHIALEGRCFVLSACQFSQESDYPIDHPVRDTASRQPSNVMIGGGSVIINPLGQVLAGPLLEGEGVLTAELDLDDIVRGKFDLMLSPQVALTTQNLGKFDLDTVGHYARSDGTFLCLYRSPTSRSRPKQVFQLHTPGVLAAPEV
jgi:hypothetical protein